MGGDLMAREWDVPGYTEVKVLGSGGFGEVVLARHDASGTLVAIKYLRGEVLADAEFAGLFRAEAAVLASLDDPNVVRLYEYVESPSGAAIVMELVDGVSLREILSRQGATTAEAALVVLQGSLLGLAAAHRRGVVHRDYKPENVLIDGAGASKLTDFGIAARAGQAAVAAGTLAYAPPEQFTGSPASPATDVYAATATFYECLTGRPPFDGDTAERLLYQHMSQPVPLEPVPEALRPLVAAGMAKDPGVRPADGAALVTELRKVAGWTCGPDWEARGRSALASAALALAALWPAAGSVAAHGGRTVHRVRLLRRLLHGHAGAGKAAVAIGIVVAGAAIAAAVVLPRSTAHTTPAPSPTPTSARATTQAPAPAQLTGTQLVSALLPLSDFPAGYHPSDTYDSGPGVLTYPGAGIVNTAGCRLGAGGVIEQTEGGWLNPFFGTAYADKVMLGTGALVLNQAIFQFASPEKALAFFSSVRTCMIDNRPWSNGVDTAPVLGDQAVTADLRPAGTDVSYASGFLFVLHGTDVFALSGGPFLSTGTVTLSVPGAAELIAKLIARVDALSPAPSAGSSPASSAGSSPTSSAGSSPAVASRRQAAQALAALLAQGGTDRAAVTQAVSTVADCSPGLSQAETVFSNAASSHQALLGQLAALPGRSALPASMLADLTLAWQASGQADQDFARWTQDEISQGCSTDYQSDAGYQAAAAPDDRATQYKKAFAALWTAIADEYGLPRYQYDQI